MSRDIQEIKLTYDMDKIKKFILSQQEVTACLIEIQVHHNEEFKKELVDTFGYGPYELVGRWHYDIETPEELYDYNEDIEGHIEMCKEDIDYISVWYEGEEEIQVIWKNENC